MVIAIPFVKPNPFHPFTVVPRIPGGELAGFKHFLRHGRGSYLELGGRSHPLGFWDETLVKLTGQQTAEAINGSD